MKDFLTYHVVSYPIQAYLTFDYMSTSHCAFLTVLSSSQEPKTFKKASSNLTWKKAIQEELQALDDNNTWDIVQLPPGKKIVGCRWI